MRVREPFNTYSHLAGAILVIVGTVLLCRAAWGNALAVGAFSVFGLGALVLYSGSTAYHWAPIAKNWLQRLDHSAIFIMIAASYTPICLLVLSDPSRWVVLGAQWMLALVGLGYVLLKGTPPKWLRLTLYLVMGWMALPFAGMIIGNSSMAVLGWMIAGGLAYSVGVFFYAKRRPLLWPGRFSNHEVWHLFVLLGTSCHFAMMANIYSH